MNSSMRVVLFASSLAGAGATMLGCADESASADRQAANERLGSVHVALTLGGTSIQSMAYTVENASHAYRGEIALTGAALLSKVIGSVQAGEGYRLTLAGATGGDAGFTCSGSAGPFTVAARTTANVAIAIRCVRASTVGGVMIGGTVNLCPFIDMMVAEPQVGGTIALRGTAEDVDSQPRPLTYAWTASPGVLTTPDAPNTTLRCSQTGPVTVQLHVNDGDPECVDSLSLQVNCAAVAATTSAQPNAIPKPQDGGSDAVSAVVRGDGASTPLLDDGGLTVTDATRRADAREAEPSDAARGGDASSRQAGDAAREADAARQAGDAAREAVGDASRDANGAHDVNRHDGAVL